MELGYKKIKAWAVIIATTKARWNYQEIKSMEHSRLQELPDARSDSDVEKIYFSRDDAYNDIEKRHNIYWHFHGAGNIPYVNATEFFVESGEITVEYGDDGEIIDMYDWDPDGNLDYTETQIYDWIDFYSYEFEAEYEKEEE